MIHSLDVRTFLWVLGAVVVSFTLVMVMLRSDRVWNGIPLWIASNLIILAATGLLLWLQPQPFLADFNLVPAGLLALNNAIKALALLARPQRRAAALAAIAVIGTYALVAGLLDPAVELNLASGAGGLVGALSVGAMGYICLRSPRWRNLRGSKLFAIAALLSAVYFLLAGLTSLSVPGGRSVVLLGPLAVPNLAVSLAFVVISHACLISMLADRLSRTAAASQMRRRRQIQLAQQAERHAGAMTALAQDRQDLLDVLIHEVRQPLNNAQAALNDAMMTLQQESRDPSSVVKIQAIIDHIVLTLSNAIIGASLLDRETQTRLVPTDLVAVCDLACSDIGLA